MSSNATSYRRFWDEAIVRILHPIQLLILESITRLEHPISATIMIQVDDRISLALYDYHCKRMVDLGLLELTAQEKRRGSSEKFYDLKM